MIRTGVGVIAAATLAVAATPGTVGQATAQQKTVKIGFVSTFSGPTAAIGNDMRNAFELGLDHHGRKLGGVPVEVIYEDDTQKPDVGVQKTQKLIEFGQGRLHCRLHLVERSFGVAQAAGRLQRPLRW